MFPTRWGKFNDPFVFWVEPKERGIIKIEEFKINRSLKKELKKQNCTIKVNETMTCKDYLHIKEKTYLI